MYSCFEEFDEDDDCVLFLLMIDFNKCVFWTVGVDDVLWLHTQSRMHRLWTNFCGL